jgi:hypothetical protein
MAAGDFDSFSSRAEAHIAAILSRVMQRPLPSKLTTSSLICTAISQSPGIDALSMLSLMRTT